MSAGFTPPPWHIVPHGDGDSLVICDDEEAMWRICFMATPGRAGSWDKIKANANLIAAAPELYEELQRTLPRNVCLTNKNVPDSTIIPLECTMGDLRRISALLAKARGEQVPK